MTFSPPDLRTHEATDQHKSNQEDRTDLIKGFGKTNVASSGQRAIDGTLKQDQYVQDMVSGALSHGSKHGLMRGCAVLWHDLAKVLHPAVDAMTSTVDMLRFVATESSATSLVLAHVVPLLIALGRECGWVDNPPSISTTCFYTVAVFRLALLQHFKEHHQGMHVIDGKFGSFADLAGSSSVTRELQVNPAHHGVATR
jgi:hypothetical protein